MYAPVKATIIDDDRFRLLAIPFGGPLPRRTAPRGVDMDGEWFSEQTDIKPDWFESRLIDWHHRGDRAVGPVIIGKAVLDDEPEEDGWWVTAWLTKQSQYLSRIRRLVEAGAELFGSSESVPGMVKRDKSTGEILVWPYVRQTLSPLPRNPFSVLRPLKATLDDYAAADLTPEAAFFDDLARFIDDLATDPADTRASVSGAKSGRVLASRNEVRLREALDALDSPYDASFRVEEKRRRQAVAAIREVLEELDRHLRPMAI